MLITGILAAKSYVIAQVAAELDALALTRATTADSIARRLRRTLNDPHLDQATCYAPVLHHLLDWDEVLRGQRRIILIVDESSKADDVHLFRVSSALLGRPSLPLAWCVWQQNVALPAGYYWTAVDAVLDAGRRAAARRVGGGRGGRPRLWHPTILTPACLRVALGHPPDHDGQP